METTIARKFKLGRIEVSPDVRRLVPDEDYLGALALHRGGDWGEVDDVRKAHNDEGLENGQLCSMYLASNGRKFWIITSPDRTRTNILLPEEQGIQES